VSLDIPSSAPDPTCPTFIRLCYARVTSSVELVRTDPSLLTELQLPAFFHAYWRRRVDRRAARLRSVERSSTRQERW
jgi:hypothetical protein